MNTDPRKTASLGICLALLVLVAAGCSQSSGKMSGTVTYKNQPLTTGVVTFITETGAATASIDSNGTYTAEEVPPGTAKVSVFVSGGAPKMKGGVGGVKDRMTIPKDLPPEAQKAFENSKKGGSGVNIPAKYLDPEQSGLTVTVKSGQNPPYNIELKD
jgi:hypothetical protein